MVGALAHPGYSLSAVRTMTCRVIAPGASGGGRRPDPRQGTPIAPPSCPGALPAAWAEDSAFPEDGPCRLRHVSRLDHGAEPSAELPPVVTRGYRVPHSGGRIRETGREGIQQPHPR